MSEVTNREQYVSRFKFDTSLAKEQRFICFDPAKTNLFWLVEPQIGTEGIEAARGNQIAKDINEHVDKQTRAMLQGLRTYLLPSAVMDKLNERGLDLIGEVVLDGVGDEILVAQEILAAVLADWQEPA